MTTKTQNLLNTLLYFDEIASREICNLFGAKNIYELFTFNHEYIENHINYDYAIAMTSL